MLQDLRHRATRVLGAIGPLLNDGEINSRKRRLARTVHRLARTLTQLLDDSPYAPDFLPEIPPADKKPCSLEAVVSSPVQLFNMAALSKGLAFNFFVSEGIKRNPYVVGDARRLQYAISEVLASSIQATECGEIDLLVIDDETALAPAGVLVTFIMRDTSRSESTTDDTRPANDDKPISHLGTVKYLIEAMNGRIKMDSSPTFGTTTVFWMAFARPSEDEIRELDSPGSDLTADTHVSQPVPYADDEEIVNAIDRLTVVEDMTGGHVIM